MSSDTDHPRQRTVAELLAEHGDTGATGRRRRRRAADDVPGEEAAPPTPSSNGSGSFAAQWQSAEPDRSMLRERVPAPAQPSSHRQPEREPQPWESAGEQRRAREPQPWEAQPREQQPWEPQPREQQPWEPQSREPQQREAQSREPLAREPRPWEAQPREPQPREPRVREPQPWEAQPREPLSREPQPWEAQPREPLGREPLQPRQRDQQPWQAGAREPLSREPQGREFPPREPQPQPQIRTPQPREPQVQPREGRREAVAWESRPREALAPPVPKPEPGRVAPPVPRPAAPATGRSPLDNPVREHPTQKMSPVRDGRPGVLDPLAPSRAASRGPGGPTDLAPPGRPEYGAPAVGDRDSDDDGPPTEIGMAPVGAEDWHRDRTRERRGAPADDGGPPTEASAPVDFDDHPAGLGGADLDDFHGDQDYRDDLDDQEPGEQDGDQDQRGGRRQRPGMQKLADSAGQVWAAVVAQWIIGAIGGAALWVGFRFLWRSLPVVALAAAVLVTVGLVVVVRALLRNSDLRTTVFAVLVGLLLTVSPAILVLVGR